MILTEDHLARLASGADIINENIHETRYFSSAGNATVFLSHKHDDLANLKELCISWKCFIQMYMLIG